jgi:hypothetical protein
LTGNPIGAIVITVICTNSSNLATVTLHWFVATLRNWVNVHVIQTIDTTGRIISKGRKGFLHPFGFSPPPPTPPTHLISEYSDFQKHTDVTALFLSFYFKIILID